MQDLKKRIALLYLKCYPFYNFLWETIALCYYLAFALRKTDYHSPLMHLTATKLTHLSFTDFSDDAWIEYIPKQQQRSVKGYALYIFVFISIHSFSNYSEKMNCNLTLNLISLQK